MNKNESQNFFQLIKITPPKMKTEKNFNTQKHLQITKNITVKKSQNSK